MGEGPKAQTKHEQPPHQGHRGAERGHNHVPSFDRLRAIQERREAEPSTATGDGADEEPEHVEGRETEAVVGETSAEARPAGASAESAWEGVRRRDACDYDILDLGISQAECDEIEEDSFLAMADDEDISIARI